MLALDSPSGQTAHKENYEAHILEDCSLRSLGKLGTRTADCCPGDSGADPIDALSHENHR